MIQLPLRLAVASLLLWPLAACGSTVTTFADEDDGTLGGGTGVSLREAVKYSPAGATLTFAPALSGQTIRLILGELLIAQSLNIDGSALAARITLSGDKTGDGKTADDTRVIQISNGTTVVLNTLIISGGFSNSGAGIHISGANGGNTKVTVQNSIFAKNSASSVGGAISCGGDLDIQNSSFTGNSARTGGGLFVTSGNVNLLNIAFSVNSATDEGGGIYNSGTLSIQDTAITGNTAAAGGGIFSGGTTSLKKSTVSGNSTWSSGGGIYASGGTVILRESTCSNNRAGPYGGGIFQRFGSLQVENSTLSGNTAKGSGGGLTTESGTATILNATVSGNSATTGGGISTSYSFILNSSIVAGNIGQVPADISGPFTGSNNITNNLSGTPPANPRLAPLGDYGGPTHTMPPLLGSPAINTGNTTTLTADQRDFPRDSVPDIGAAEYQGAADLARFWKLDFDGDGSPYGTEQALGTDPLSADPAHSRRLTAPVFNTSGHAVLTFGLAPAAPGTVWILRRSTDLLTFSEIYRYDGTTDTAAPGIICLRTATGVTVTDENPFPGGAFYRFEARLAP